VYTRASTLLSWVALWALGFVLASERARNGGCGSGSSLTPSSDQTLIDQLDTIEGVDFEVSETLGNTDCTILTAEDAEILDDIRNKGTGNDKGTTLNCPSFSETPISE
jgi:hypothetical protein